MKRKNLFWNRGSRKGLTFWQKKVQSFLLSDRGAFGSTLDVMIGTAVGVILLSTIVPWWLQTQHRQLMDQTTAQEIRQISNGLAGYTKAYASSIESVATASKPAVISVSMLVSTGFLPAGTQAIDPYGQTIVGEVLQPTSGYLVGAVVTQGGNSPSGSHINQLATLIGAQGGFVPPSSLSTLPGICGTNCFQGAGNAWHATFSQYPFTGVGPGSLIALQSYNANNLPQDFLYRSNVPGFPQANQMQTNINMNGNNLDNTGTVQTYNLASPNGYVNMNGQTLGNTRVVETNPTTPATDALGYQIAPCPTYTMEYTYWKGECSCLTNVWACFTGIVTNGVPVFDRMAEPGGVFTTNQPPSGSYQGQTWRPGY